MVKLCPVVAIAESVSHKNTQEKYQFQGNNLINNVWEIFFFTENNFQQRYLIEMGGIGGSDNILGRVVYSRGTQDAFENLLGINLTNNLWEVIFSTDTI